MNWNRVVNANWKKKLFLCLILAASITNAAGLEDPKGYAENSNLQWSWGLQAIEKYPWSGREKVLDIGCGDGKITVLLSEKYTVASVIGLDISKEMIKFASSRILKNTHLNLFFQEGDINCLPFHEQFDLVVSFCSLHYIIEQEKGLKQIYESLHSGGKLLLVIPGKDNTNLVNVSETLINGEKWSPFFPSFKKQRVFFTQREYEDLLTEANFEPIYFNLSHDHVGFSNRSAYLDWLRPLINYTSHLSVDLREEFLSDLADQLLLFQIPTEDDSILLQSTTFECLYQKKD